LRVSFLKQYEIPILQDTYIMTVKELLGHKTLAMTLRYSHLSPNFQRSTVELLCNRMDTFWTPEGIKASDTKQAETKILLNNKVLSNFAAVAELADAQDLKS